MTKKSFKLEYLSAGTNQPDAFIVTVNPLILLHLVGHFPKALS